jgi:glutamyl-tRNA reductase
MSGGHFDYKQHQITLIIDDLQEVIDKNRVERTEEELRQEYWYGDNMKEYYEKYPDQKLYYNYSDETIEEFKKGLYYLKLAHIYTQRIDWLLSGDDGEESFFKRLKEELKELTLKNPIENDR